MKFISSYQDADFVYIAMEYMAIGDVSKTFTNDYRWNESDTKAVIEQVLHGLVAMHKESITHRDLKPEVCTLPCEGTAVKPNSHQNIFLCLPAGTAQVIHVKIGDFGASKHVPLSSTSTFLKTSIGTVGYMAPEMLDTSIAKTNEVDIWSLGCILFRMFTGSLLFKDLSELYKYALSPPPQTLGLENIGFSAPCVNFLNDALQASPEDRPSAQACLERDWIMNKAPGLQYTIGNDLYTSLSMVGVGAPNIDTFRQTVAEDKEDEGAGLSREDI